MNLKNNEVYPLQWILQLLPLPWFVFSHQSHCPPVSGVINLGLMQTLSFFFSVKLSSWRQVTLIMPLDCCSQVHVIFNSFLATLSRVLLTNAIQRSKQFVQCCSASKKQLTVLLDAYKARHTYITLWLQACSVEIKQLSFSLYIQDFKFHTLHSNHNENTIIACKFLNGHNALLSYIYIYLLYLLHIYPFYKQQ